MAVDPVTNFGKVLVSTGYNDTDTSIVLSSGDGAKLPDPSTDGDFNVVWFNNTDYFDPSDDPNREIVRVTAKSSDTLTVTRAQEGTSASIKNLSGKNYRMILGVTKKTVDDLQKVNLLDATGTIDDSNVEFTFTQEPSIININGALYPKETGIYNWTWDGGTLTATLAVAVGTGGFIVGIK